MTWVQGRVPQMSALVDETLALADAGLPTDTFNTICRARLRPNDEARVDRALGYFRKRGLPFSWWVGPGDTPGGLERILESRGLEFAESEIAMAAPLARLNGTNAVPDRLRIDRVTLPGMLREFAEVTAANWSPPDRHVLAFYEAASAELLSRGSPFRFYVGRIDGQAVAGAEVVVTGRVAGLYNVSTLEGFRRRGIGFVMTVQSLLDAGGTGADLGILQASAAGVGVYERAGLRAFGEYREFKPIR